MAEKSVFVYDGISSPAKAKKYSLKLSSKVNDNEVIVNKKSNQLQVDIQKNYDNIAALFNAIAINYRTCAKKSVKGDKIVSSLKKVAKKCEDQAESCLKRKNQLIDLYKADATKANVEALENFLGSDLVTGGYIRYEQEIEPIHIID